MTITPTTSETSDSPPDIIDRDLNNELVTFVKDKYRKCKDQRSKQEIRWYTNLAYYFGRQWISTATTQGSTKLTTPKAPYWRARPVVNKIRPAIRKEISKIVSTKPTAYVVPNSSEDQDLFAAQAGEQIWESYYEDQHVYRTVRSAAFWTSICGTSFFKSWWDPEKQDGLTGMPGSIEVTYETPFHIFVPDLAETDIENQSYIIHASIKPLEWAKLHYQDKVADPIQATSRALNIMDTGFLKLIGAEDPPEDSVEIVEMWIKPGHFDKYPLGALITLVGDQVGQFSPIWPYTFQKYPFAKMTHVATGGFYGESTITDLIPLQREYNRTRGQIIEAKNRMAKPQLIAPQGSIDPNKITTEPGQVILYKMGYTPPTPLPLQPLPNYVLEEQQRIAQDFDDIIGQHEVSRGTVPPGVTAATAISYLQEQDDTMLAATIDSLEEAVQKIAQCVLNYVVEFWDVERTIKVTGTDQSFDTMVLKGSDLHSNTDIRIEKGSALPTSRAAKQAFVMDLMKMGFIDPTKGLEVMEVGGVTKLYENIQIDVRQAQRENLKMQQIPEEVSQQWEQAQQMWMGFGGMDPETMQPMEPPPPPVPVNSWDNHMVHIETHNNFRKSQTFESLPEHLKRAFEAHVQLHEMSAAQQMGAIPGGPGQAPGPGPMMGPPQGAPPQPEGGSESGTGPDGT